MRTLKILVLMLLAGFKCFAQLNAPNIGFEDGTFDHWLCSTGKIDTAGNIVVFPGVPVPTMYTVLGPGDARLVDYYGNFPVLTPNGSKHSIRLGNIAHGNTVQRISYTLDVPAAATNSIIFNYAVILENPGHLPYQQPKFTFRVFDVTDNTYLDCPAFDFNTSNELPGFKVKDDSVFYKDWSTATVDLKNYRGKTVRLEFTVNHCPFGQHFGYVYLDVDESVDSSINGNAYCNGQNTVTLSAPAGFASYTWYGDDMAVPIDTGQNLHITPAPPDGAKYAVRITPYNGLGCIDTLYTIVNKIDNGFKLNVADTLRACPGSAVDLTAPAVTAGSSAGMKLSYYTDSLAAHYLAYPDKVYTPGAYYIKGTNAEGCTNIVKVQVDIALPVITVTDPPEVTYPETVDLSKTFTPQPGITYRYYKNAEATSPVEDYTAVVRGGTYYIEGTTAAGCSVIAAVNVKVNVPPFTINAPNVFTPNNDGINDNFMVGLKGYLSFISLKIYNRYGMLVYTAKTSAEFWDGRFNGRQLPAGTYYWVFEGVDEYYDKKVTRAASITLLR
ncbi:gliding motility-associated C-terminal domain-containing protein [Mucilaginibacter segetis]|uniref:Gliding motility-associated C-terminal domain-containing protein n=1 Tax=Mucilaginibacter segetis TaxID=2793071 RepID=A0A934ULX2_9SPHI|nr:gliding motility-associated C-terminal domain-containing protein [Mucilaginibacter segetis]MBK0378415.1 gliding motility-associated C-terminal domain-containing protein [Mucilaginibacter segetis]